MDFTEDIFLNFKKKFSGYFMDLLPDEIPVYVDSKENIFVLEYNVKELIEKSLKENKNYLLGYERIILNPNVYY